MFYPKAKNFLIVFTGSNVPNIPVPDTSISAPAAKTSFAFSSLTSPSTEISGLFFSILCTSSFTSDILDIISGKNV